MNFRVIFLGLFSLFFVFTSCKSKKGMTDNEMPALPDNSWLENANGMLAGKTWKLVEINGTKVSYADNKVKEAYIMFSATEESITGNNSCNTLNGSYELMKGNKIKIKEVAASKMACKNNTIEKQLMEVLRVTDNYSVGANSLNLHSGTLTSIAKFKVVN